MSLSPQDHIEITRLLYTIGLSQDTLDWALFTSCWITSQPLHIDLSSHLSQFSPTQTFTPQELAETCHKYLAGYDGTQHVVTNVIIDILEPMANANIDKQGKLGEVRDVSAKAMITAYHEYRRPVEEGPTMAIVRGTWDVRVVTENGKWKASGIKVVRLVGVEGDERLYGLAKERQGGGQGRRWVTGWD
ncbi:hypothetical protein GGR57DRAFT_499968 [Xylariaceae sp. FL1272]|nr:hypothetical protein GGR57DRAFT_499968 [Xylariaceae sp. FL1272]